MSNGAEFSISMGTRVDTVPYIEQSSPRDLATGAEREVPRATLQRARSAKFPAPLATSAEREVPRAGNNGSVYFHKKTA